jgi:tetratricopeptide (TPR) repeat protein
MNRQMRRAAMRKAGTPQPVHPFPTDARLPGASRANAAEIAALLQRGIADHQAGRLEQAATAYRQILAAEPDNAHALYLLGIIERRFGRNEAAVDYISRALRSRGPFAEAYINLGNALRDLGRLAEAEKSYSAGVRLRPDLPEAHLNFANLLFDLGRRSEAEACFRGALRHRPEYVEAHGNLGNVLRDTGRFAEAEACYQAALRLAPDHAKTHNNFGTLLGRRGRRAEAEACFRAAIRYRPEYVEAHSNLGNVLRETGRFAEAEASCQAALRFSPGHAAAHNNLGALLGDLSRFAEAEASCREALRLDPDYTDARSNLAFTLHNLGRPSEAEAAYREVLQRRPGDADTHANFGNLLLSVGRFDEGWREYEWRWRSKQLIQRHFEAPRWNGEPLGDRVILLHAEQGFGDTLQFCRYATLFGAGARIVLEVQTPLARLMASLPGGATIVARGDPLPPFDLHCPLMSLPLVFGTTLETIPGTTPYLRADPALSAAWRERLAGLDGTRVGLVWAGNRVGFTDLRRSISLDIMAPLGDMPGVAFVSLQKGESAAQTAHPPPGLAVYDLTADLHDFADTAALIDNLDLVISVDTAVAHLAGAIGKPVWLLNRFDTCWRWLRGRDDSPWYPTLRQFRQPNPGDWSPVIAAVHDALGRLLAGDRTQLRASD